MSTDPTGLRPSAGIDDAALARPGPGDDAVDRDPPSARTDAAPTEPAPSRSRERADNGRTGRRSHRVRKVRRVHRVVRHLDVWSVAKVAAIFAACAYVVGMISGYLLWRAADRVGTIDGIEGFFEDAGGYDTFHLVGSVVFRSAAIIGLVLAALAVFLVVLAALLFNLISDLTGGIRMTVIDEDLVVAPTPRRRERVAPADRPDAPPRPDATRPPG